MDHPKQLEALPSVAHDDAGPLVLPVHSISWDGLSLGPLNVSRSFPTYGKKPPLGDRLLVRLPKTWMYATFVGRHPIRALRQLDPPRTLV